jgi:DNA-binding Xre family transcriptional regulator
MHTMPFKWKVKPMLEAYNITPYRLAKDSGLSNTTVYAIVNGESENLQGRVLDKLLGTLEDLTGKKLRIQDVVEWERDAN